MRLPGFALLALLAAGISGAAETPLPGTAPISVHVRDADIRDVFATIGKLTGRSIVVAPDVAARVTLDLDDVPAAQVLSLIAKTHDLAYEDQGNVLLVETLAKARARAAAKAADEDRPAQTITKIPSAAERAAAEVRTMHGFELRQGDHLLANGDIQLGSRRREILFKDGDGKDGRLRILGFVPSEDGSRVIVFDRVDAPLSERRLVLPLQRLAAGRAALSAEIPAGKTPIQATVGTLVPARDGRRGTLVEPVKGIEPRLRVEIEILVDEGLQTEVLAAPTLDLESGGEASSIVVMPVDDTSSMRLGYDVAAVRRGPDDAEVVVQVFGRTPEGKAFDLASWERGGGWQKKRSSADTPIDETRRISFRWKVSEAPPAAAGLAPIPAGTPADAIPERNESRGSASTAK